MLKQESKISKYAPEIVEGQVCARLYDSNGKTTVYYELPQGKIWDFIQGEDRKNIEQFIRMDDDKPF